ncbi:unnamed protein product [Cercopithifilaria johnstoni]|uniref:Uncharacterized protein n=1 Tax=Cercopithifilaria johnstoni TaxID=2874296 RepID=A0A8J2M1F6_9BILA|nr:unnamed protein product [Cercopithifilaria johnstoni]
MTRRNLMNVGVKCERLEGIWGQATSQAKWSWNVNGEDMSSARKQVEKIECATECMPKPKKLHLEPSLISNLVSKNYTIPISKNKFVLCSDSGEGLWFVH